jgi:hypothetical protein
MHYVDIQGGIIMPLNEEENTIFMLSINGGIMESDLDLRQKEVALKMLSRGALVSVFQNNKLYYQPNSLDNVWRF